MLIIFDALRRHGLFADAVFATPAFRALTAPDAAASRCQR
jgi:hypothetical protein